MLSHGNLDALIVSCDSIGSLSHILIQFGQLIISSDVITVISDQIFEDIKCLVHIFLHVLKSKRVIVEWIVWIFSNELFQQLNSVRHKLMFRLNKINNS